MKYLCNSCVTVILLCSLSASLGAQEGSISIPSTLPDIRDQIKKYDTGMFFCNKSDANEVHIAIHSRSGRNWNTKGWYSVQKNGCIAVLPTIENQYIYYYAKGEGLVWEGDSKHCVHVGRAFSIPSGRCTGDQKLYGFRTFKTGDVAKYVATLN